MPRLGESKEERKRRLEKYFENVSTVRYGNEDDSEDEASAGPTAVIANPTPQKSVRVENNHKPSAEDSSLLSPADLTQSVYTLLKKATAKSPARAKVEVPEFDGTKNPTKWRQQFEIAIRDIDPSTHIRVLSTALKGEALEWFTDQYPTKPTLSVNDWLAALEAEFQLTCDQHELEIQSVKYNPKKHDPATFVKRIESRVNAMTCCKDRHKRRMALILRETMSEHPKKRLLYANFPPTPDTLIGQLILLENPAEEEETSSSSEDERPTKKRKISVRAANDTVAVVNNQSDGLADIHAKLAEMQVLLAQPQGYGYRGRGRGGYRGRGRFGYAHMGNRAPFVNNAPQQPGCWNCGDPQHIRANCPHVQPSSTGYPPQANRFPALAPYYRPQLTGAPPANQQRFPFQPPFPGYPPAITYPTAGGSAAITAATQQSSGNELSPGEDQYPTLGQN